MHGMQSKGYFNGLQGRPLMGIWDSIKGGAGAAWDHTGGKLAAVPSNAWDAHQRANEEGRIFGLNPDKSLYQGLDGVADFAKGAANVGFDVSPPGIAWNLNKYLKGQWSPTVSEEQTALEEAYNAAAAKGAWDRPFHNAETDARLAGFAPQENDPFTRPDFDPNAITGPYDSYLDSADSAFNSYMGLLEGISTSPRTSRIEGMYKMAQDEANRRLQSAEKFESSGQQRIDTDADIMYGNLEIMEDKFLNRLDKIQSRREKTRSERETERNAVIAETAGSLGDAGAAFLVEATRSGDILGSQRDRNTTHMDDMDALFAGWSLDRTMSAQGLEKQERRKLVDDVLAMKEAAHEFRYEAGQDFQERMFTAEESAASRQADMDKVMAELRFANANTRADIGFKRDVALGEAQDEFDSEWDRAQAFYENPVTANAFFGMDPSMMGGADPSEFVDYWLAIQEMQSKNAGDDIGPIVIDPVYGAPWSGGYVIDPATGQPVFDPSGMGSISEAVGMDTGDLVSNIYTPPGL